MLLTTEKLIGSDVIVEGEKVGKASDIYFDDEHWALRYLVDKSGFLIFGKKLLHPIDKASDFDVVNEKIHLDIKKEQLEKGPSFDMKKPVSKENETKLMEYHGMQPYWGGGAAMPNGTGITPGAAGAPVLPARDIVRDKTAEAENTLRSAAEMIGYTMEAADGEIGKVHDLIIDDNMRIEYIVVKADELKCRDFVLISPEWIQYISYLKKEFSLDKDKEYFETCPEYKKDEKVTDKLKDALSEFFKK